VNLGILPRGNEFLGGKMTDRRKKVMDIRDMLMRVRAGDSYRRIERDTGIDRRTVKSYREWAAGQGLLRGELPPIEQLQTLLEQTRPEKLPPQNGSSVESYRAVVEPLVSQQVEIAAIRERLKEQGFSGSYSAVYRFVRQLKPKRVDV